MYQVIDVKAGEVTENMTHLLSQYQNFVIGPSDRFSKSSEIIATNDPKAAKEILKSCDGYSIKSGKGKIVNVVPKLYKNRDYRVVFYDNIENSKHKQEYNVFPRLREIFPVNSKIDVVSRYNYPGAYRQQNIVRILAVVDNKIEDVTYLVSRAIYNKYNYNHNGIQCDTSAYQQDISDAMGWALYGDSKALTYAR